MTVSPETIKIDSGEFWGRDPQDELAWMRANAPVYWNEASGLWGIASYDLVKEVEGNPAAFSNANGIRPDTGPIPMMIDMDDPQHKVRRKLVSRGFTPQRVRALEPRIDQIVNRLIDRVCEQGTCDFVWDLAAWLPLIMIGDALGVDESDHPTLLEWSDDLLRGQGQTDPVAIEKMIGAFAGYCEYAEKVIADRRENSRDDLISVLVDAEVDGEKLSDDALIHESLLILIGGDETTRHVISGGGYQLLTHRDQWDRLRADRSLMETAVEEMLRWVSPIKNMARTVTTDVEFHGCSMKAGQQLLLLYPSANRDETHFDDPFQFDIERTPNDHVAFGFGTHFCLGSSLARLELRGFFNVLADRLPDIRPVGDAEPEFRAASFISGYEAMPVEFTPTSPVGA